MRPGKSKSTKTWSWALTHWCPCCLILSALPGMALGCACCHPPRQGLGQFACCPHRGVLPVHILPPVPPWQERGLSCKGTRLEEPCGLFYSPTSGSGPQMSLLALVCMKVLAHRIKEIWDTWSQKCLPAMLSFLCNILDLKLSFSSSPLWRIKLSRSGSVAVLCCLALRPFQIKWQTMFRSNF